MINKKKKEDVITEEKTEYACPMMDAIAMITARDFDESGMFDPDSPHTVLICDLIFKLYLSGLYVIIDSQYFYISYWINMKSDTLF